MKTAYTIARPYFGAPLIIAHTNIAQNAQETLENILPPKSKILELGDSGLYLRFKSLGHNMTQANRQIPKETYLAIIAEQVEGYEKEVANAITPCGYLLTKRIEKIKSTRIGQFICYFLGDGSNWLLLKKPANL